jgi:hypothetical protein
MTIPLRARSHAPMGRAHRMKRFSTGSCDYSRCRAFGSDDKKRNVRRPTGSSNISKGTQT